MNTCLNPKCAKETRNKKFCSRSCAAVILNHINPKRTPATKYCQKCSGAIGTKTRRKLCDNCTRRVDWATRTIGESQKYNYQINVVVRQHARIVMASDPRPRKCKKCGYSSHVEVCHKKAINNFPTTALFSEVNSPSNLLYLCPNHHWEFDNAASIEL